MAQQIELDLRDYIRIVRRHRWKIMAITAAVTLVTFAFSYSTKPRPLYEAIASLKFERKTAGEDIYRGYVQAPEYSEIESEMQAITSFPVIIGAAYELELVPQDLTFEEIQRNRKYLNRILGLQREIEIDQEEDTNIITVSYESHDPEYCRDVPNAIAKAYQALHLKESKKQVSATREFIEKRLLESKAKLKRLEEAKKEFEETHDIVDIKAQMQILLESQIGLEQKIRDATNRISQMEAMAKDFNTADGSDEILVDIRPSMFSSHFEQMVTDLMKKVAKKKSLLNVYREKNPEVIAVQQEITNSIENIKGHIEASTAIMKKEKEDLEFKKETSNSDLEKIPENNLTHSRLKRDVEITSDVVKLLDNKYQGALIREADQVENVRIIAPAFLPLSPINAPNVLAKTVLGFFLGMILGTIFAFIFEHFDTSFETIDDVEGLLDLSVIGVVPFLNLKELVASVGEDDPIISRLTMDDPLSRMVIHHFPKSVIAESYRSLRTNVMFSVSREKGKIICITSSLPGEGKSTVSANLSLTLAQAGKRVLLIDADLRKSTLHKVLGVENTPGLVDLVLESVEPATVIHDVTDIMMGKIGMERVARTPGWDNLDFIPPGQGIPGNVTEILDSSNMRSFLAKCREEYDYIIIDTPPVLAVSDILILTPMSDGTLIVYKVGSVARGSLARAKALLAGVKTNILGVVLNGLKEEVSADFGQVHYEYYGHKEAHEEHTFIRKVVHGTIFELKHLIKEGVPLEEQPFYAKMADKAITRLNLFLRQKEEKEKLKSPSEEKIAPFIVTPVIILMMLSAFLYHIRSVEGLLAQYGDFDFQLTGILLLVITAFYFGLNSLWGKISVTKHSKSSGSGRRKKSSSKNGKKKKKEEKKEEEKPYTPPTPPTTPSPPPAAVAVKKEVEVGASVLQEKQEESQSENGITFSSQEKSKIDSIDKKINGGSHTQEKINGDKPDERIEPDKDDWDSFLNPKA